MSKKRATFSEVKALIAGANKMGADLRIPNPDEKPLIILEFNSSKSPKTQTHRFHTMKTAKKWLTEFIDELYEQQKEKKQTKE